jgi:hypothetical protein
VKKHFVTFYSLGTFVSETSEKPIDSWDVEKAKSMIKEKYSATPYGFQFSTRERKDDELDSKVTKTSGLYYLGGTVETLAEFKEHAKGKDSILISNMECNGWDRIITYGNSRKRPQPLKKEDVVLEWEKE